MPQRYVKGTAIITAVEVRDEEGNLADPATIRLRILPPSASEIDVTAPTHEGLGAYSHEFVADAEGLWHYRWETTSPTAAEEHRFEVDRSAFT